MSSPVELVPLGLEGLFWVERKVHFDPRGSFCELWNVEEFQQAGWSQPFEQDSLSHSRAGVLRGLHFQDPPQAKLITLLQGRTHHVMVDVRPKSTTWGRHQSVELVGLQPRSLLVDAGFAHGFVALEDSLMVYKSSRVHRPGSEFSLRWDDPQLAIRWPLSSRPIVSERDDARALSWQDLASGVRG